MPRAFLDDTLIAESDRTIVVEGNHYFPPDSVRREHLQPSPRTSVCPWKGNARYYDVVAGGRRAEGAAWYYPQPKDAAAQIRDHVAFWRGVRVVD